MTDPSADRVHIDFRKWGGSLHWQFEMRRIGEDEHGVWLFAPAGTTARRGTDPSMETEHAFVKLVRPRTWWTAIWNAGGGMEVYVDVTTPAETAADRVTMTDLDLDVVRWRDGRTEILDEDEFLEHSRRYHYPEQVIDTARSVAAWLVLALETRREPFGATGLRWLELAS